MSGHCLDWVCVSGDYIERLQAISARPDIHTGDVEFPVHMCPLQWFITPESFGILTGLKMHILPFFGILNLKARKKYKTRKCLCL